MFIRWLKLSQRDYINIKPFDIIDYRYKFPYFYRIMDLSVEFARDFSRERICRENCIAQVFCLDLYNYVFCIDHNQNPSHKNRQQNM